MLSKLNLSLVMLFGFTIMLSVTVVAGIPVLDITAKNECYEINCVRCQLMRLQELCNGDITESFNTNGEPINIPKVNFIVRPEGDRDYFLIGVENEPTPKCIDFILAHTGIPQERAHIARTYHYNDLGYEYDDTMPLPEEFVDPQGITPFSTAWAMGRRISIEGLGGNNWGTLGHPLDSLGNSFATSPHEAGLRGRSVSIHGVNEIIGYIRESFFERHRDVAIVDMRENIHSVHPNVQGRPITSYRTPANKDDSVISIRASGTHDSSVYTANAVISTQEGAVVYHDVILIYPDGDGVRGDSGAALIRMNTATDRAILGTRNGSTVMDCGRRFGRYTSVLQYGVRITGDLDGDGRVTSADATRLARLLAGHAVSADLRAADINGDGRIDIFDLILFQRWLAGHDVAHLIAPSVW